MRSMDESVGRVAGKLDHRGELEERIPRQSERQWLKIYSKHERETFERKLFNGKLIFSKVIRNEPGGIYLMRRPGIDSKRFE